MVLKLNTDRMGHLEVEDDGPYKTQRQLGVSIGDIVIPDIHQLDLCKEEPYGTFSLPFN